MMNDKYMTAKELGEVIKYHPKLLPVFVQYIKSAPLRSTSTNNEARHKVIMLKRKLFAECSSKSLRSQDLYKQSHLQLKQENYLFLTRSHLTF